MWRTRRKTLGLSPSLALGTPLSPRAPRRISCRRAHTAVSVSAPLRRGVAATQVLAHVHCSTDLAALVLHLLKPARARCEKCALHYPVGSGQVENAGSLLLLALEEDNVAAALEVAVSWPHRHQERTRVVMSGEGADLNVRDVAAAVLDEPAQRAAPEGASKDVARESPTAAMHTLPDHTGR
eukprot:CAMPEP_0171921998 /NCGR_PEP_ID=MMETSP0993-20121228/20744_1 /TAXON_ID=483369 /ORGANISM="non described non described, Strain CCMP2098" /LENGTH=181 /DNA_ID=CAMNT_0012559545 /DNA_START=300 /DNA_END=846 /DNA_ORIENTATION=+